MKNNYVLTKEVKEEHVSANGIILSAEKYNRKAKVIKTSSSAVAEDDIIIKAIGQGTVFKINGEEHEILNENHIFGTIQ